MWSGKQSSGYLKVEPNNYMTITILRKLTVSPLPSILHQTRLLEACLWALPSNRSHMTTETSEYKDIITQIHTKL